MSSAEAAPSSRSRRRTRAHARRALRRSRDRRARRARQLRARARDAGAARGRRRGDPERVPGRDPTRAQRRRSGAAWQAWASRALGAGASTSRRTARARAGTRAVRVPGRARRRLGGCSAASAIAAAARALLRLRLERRRARAIHGLALAATEDPALRAAAKSDRGVARARARRDRGAVWTRSARARCAIARTTASTCASPRRAQRCRRRRRERARALLLSAARCSRHGAPRTQALALPRVLARFARIGCGREPRRAGGARCEMHNDLRAQPNAYLKCARALARTRRTSSGRSCSIMRATHAARSIRLRSSGALPKTMRARSRGADAPRRAPPQHVWFGALAAAAAVVAATWPWRGLLRPATAIVAMLLLWPLRRGLDRVALHPDAATEAGRGDRLGRRVARRAVSAIARTRCATGPRAGCARRTRHWARNPCGERGVRARGRRGSRGRIGVNVRFRRGPPQPGRDRASPILVTFARCSVRVFVSGGTREGILVGRVRRAGGGGGLRTRNQRRTRRPSATGGAVSGDGSAKSGMDAGFDGGRFGNADPSAIHDLLDGSYIPGDAAATVDAFFINDPPPPMCSKTATWNRRNRRAARRSARTTRIAKAARARKPA